MSNRTAIVAKTMVPRFQSLDGLRGVAALLVVLLHVEWSNHITGLRFVKNGYLAVDLFFILSGLVIAANYSARITNARTALRFMALRFFRLYPLHFAMLTALVGLECIKVLAQSTLGIIPEHHPFTGGQSPQSFVAHVLLVQGLGLLPTPGWNGPSWSISCEFVVYELFAITTLLGLFRNRVFLVLGAIATGLGYAVLALTRGTLNVVYDLGLVRCIAGFFWGVLICRWALVASTRSLKQMQLFEIGVTVAVISTMATISGGAILIVIPLLILLVMLLRSDRGPVARLLMSKPAQYLGRISYSVYMVHYFIIVCVLMALKRIAPAAYNRTMEKDFVFINPWIGDVILLAVVATVVLVASRTYTLIEEPGRQFGRRILQRDVAFHQIDRSPVYVDVNSPRLDPTAMRQQ
jgi:peptidoglycan/LPS O-acetylase OafA/YrhL